MVLVFGVENDVPEFWPVPDKTLCGGRVSESEIMMRASDVR
jgi:hypothetical protein